jgi:hypothetical protein
MKAVMIQRGTTMFMAKVPRRFLIENKYSVNPLMLVTTWLQQLCAFKVTSNRVNLDTFCETLLSFLVIKPLSQMRGPFDSHSTSSGVKVGFFRADYIMWICCSIYTRKQVDLPLK